MQKFVTADFAYDLPEQLIAQAPLPERDQSRLLRLGRASGSLTDGHFSDIVDQLQAGDLLVLNNTRVIPARIFGQKISGGRLEALVERVIDTHTAWLHIKSSKSPKVGAKLQFCAREAKLSDAASDSVFEAEMVAREGALFVCRFVQPVMSVLAEIGEMPLPPYIERAAEHADAERYQTVFAKNDGAVAAPTASLHFTETLLSALQTKGVERAEVTLHVGAGTFQPVRVERLDEHTMHSEILEVSASTVDAIARCRARGGRVIAVGTTVVRALESAAQSGKLCAMQGETEIFITPGYDFRVVDGLVTNFHLPESTLIMLVSAFAGYEATMTAYRHAVAQQYRFFSYGDAMLIL